VPDLDAFQAITKSTGEREISNTMAFVRGLNLLLRDKSIAPHVVPIVVDEARTFGMESMFRQIAIYAPGGQKYRPQDADQLLYYHESEDGQVLQEGISEAGGLSAWIAAGTSYSVSNQPMLPFFIFYSFFGFRRVGDLILAAADQRTRGFLIGATAGRAFAGEGLQHSDGSSHLMASAIPNCKAYDPAYSYELAVILRGGIKEMYEDQRDVFYYITVTNHNYSHPDMPDGCADGIIRGMYLLRDAGGAEAGASRVQLLGSGSLLLDVVKAAELLETEFGVKADVWSCTSFSELARDGFDCERWNRLHAAPSERRTSYVAKCLVKHPGPVIAASEYVRNVIDPLRTAVPEGRRFITLGTDGFGRSDTAEALRTFFEVDHRWIVHAAIRALAEDGMMNASDVERAIKTLGIDSDKPNPITM
jgi:pyruvate dehydrogenase E1 component